MDPASNIVEIIDPEDDSLFHRVNQLSSLKGLGPADLCHLVRESSKLSVFGAFSKKTVWAAYHHVYGIDTSSQSSVAAYFQNFIEYKGKVNRHKLLQGTFCIMDLFSRHDIRIEVRIPGQLHSYALNDNGEIHNMNPYYWKGAYISSVMRYFYREPAPASNIRMWPSSPSDFRYFFNIAWDFLHRLGFVIGDLSDTVRYAEHLLFPATSQFLISRRILELHFELFTKIATEDPLMLCYIADSQITMKRCLDGLKTLAPQLFNTPHAVPLLLREAKALLGAGKLSTGIELAFYTIQMNPQFFDSWEILAEGYLKMKDYGMVLSVINNAPLYAVEKKPNYYKEVPASSLLKPEAVSLNASNLVFKPTEMDFRDFETTHTPISSKEISIMKNLESLPGKHLSECRKRLYKLLVLVEKEIGWDSLLKLRSQVFLIEDDHSITLPQFYEESMVNEQNVDLNQSAAIINTRGNQLNVTAPKPLADIEEDFGLSEGQIPPPNLASKSTDKVNLGAPEPTPRQYFLNSPTSNKADTFVQNKRFISKHLDSLFNALFHDLKALFEWQAETNDIDRVQKPSKIYSRGHTILW